MEKTTRVFVLLLFSSSRIEGLRVKKKIELDKSTPSSYLNSEYETRKGRFLNMFSLFSVVSFENTDCTTSSETQGDFELKLGSLHAWFDIITALVLTSHWFTLEKIVLSKKDNFCLKIKLIKQNNKKRNRKKNYKTRNQWAG